MLTDEELDKLRKDHGEIAHVVYDGNDIVLRKCKPGEYKLFRSTSFNEKRRDVALETLVRSTWVYPARDRIEEFFEKYPAIAESIGGEAMRLAGLIDADIKK